jgi:regulator of replication initiation timing
MYNTGNLSISGLMQIIHNLSKTMTSKTQHPDLELIIKENEKLKLENKLLREQVKGKIYDV